MFYRNVTIQNFLCVLEVDMNEKRLHPRYSCRMKVHFHFFEGDPDIVDIKDAPFKKGKGTILDISCGGMFIATNERVSVNIPISVTFRNRRTVLAVDGTIIRTGLLTNNPSGIARKFKLLRTKKDFFIAVRFSQLLENLDESDLLAP
jgi:hypothetical protein